MTREKEEKMIREDWFKDHKAKYGKEHIPLGKSQEGDLIAPLTQIIMWKRPESYNYSITYMVRGAYLFVTGDLGDAIYCAGSVKKHGFKFFLDCDRGYFASKCIASEEGRGYEIWDSSYVEEQLKEVWKSHCYERTLENLNESWWGEYLEWEDEGGPVEGDYNLEDRDDQACYEADILRWTEVKKKKEEFDKDFWKEGGVAHFDTSDDDDLSWRSAHELGISDAFESKFGYWNWMQEYGYKFFGEYWPDIAGDVNGDKVSIRCHGHLIGLKMALKQLGVDKKDDV